MKPLMARSSTEQEDRTVQSASDAGTTAAASRQLSLDRRLGSYDQPAHQSSCGVQSPSRTGGNGNVRPSPAPLVAFPRVLSAKVSLFTALQKWEGTVLEVRADEFTARLVDLTRQGADEHVELSVEELSKEDLPLLAPGAVFYWSIGYLTTPHGQKRRSSEIRFRRLPAWTPAEIHRAWERAQDMKDTFGEAPERTAAKA